MKLILSLIIFFQVLPLEARINDIFEKHTSIKKPFELRDPFQPPKLETKGQTERKKRFSGIWDYEQRLESDVKIEEIKITGVLIGKNRRVLIQTKAGKKPFTFKEGETIGPNGPVIKAILPGGIILVEQIENIYGEPEYIETVIPISK
jgi:Tfp pilus assembly protein PilP